MRKKVVEWVKRYLPAEIFGAIGSVAGAWVVFSLTGHRILSVYAAVIWENAGYYGFIALREILKNQGKNKGDELGVINFIKSIRNLVLEFGPAEILDSLLIRPFSLYVFTILIKEYSLGIIIGKLVADIIFYIPTIISYELRKKYFK